MNSGRNAFVREPKRLEQTSSTAKARVDLEINIVLFDDFVGNKRLGRDGRFEWPRISDGVMHLTRVQFEALFDGLNWKRMGERIVPTPAAAN